MAKPSLMARAAHGQYGHTCSAGKTLILVAQVERLVVHLVLGAHDGRGNRLLAVGVAVSAQTGEPDMFWGSSRSSSTPVILASLASPLNHYSRADTWTVKAEAIHRGSAPEPKKPTYRRWQSPQLFSNRTQPPRCCLPLLSRTAISTAAPAVAST